jgi:copper chaperone CopZ
MYQAVLKNDGMACGMCEAHIKDVIRATEPTAKKVKASHTSGEVSFAIETPPEEEKLRAAIDKTGYRLLSMDVSLYEKRNLFGR